MAAVLSSGCSIRSMAVNALSDTLTEGASVYASDDDPELVREALPFNLKTIETLLQSSPDHPRLLLIACSTFTQYAARLHSKPMRKSPSGTILTTRRPRVSKIRALKHVHPSARLLSASCGGRLPRSFGSAAAPARRSSVPSSVSEDIETMYWLGGSWGFAISLGLDRPDLAADMPVVRALLARALELDEDYSRGALHAAFITLESVPELLGGSPDRARGSLQEGGRAFGWPRCLAVCRPGHRCIVGNTGPGRVRVVAWLRARS